MRLDCIVSYGTRLMLYFSKQSRQRISLLLSIIFVVHVYMFALILMPERVSYLIGNGLERYLIAACGPPSVFMLVRELFRITRDN